MIPLRDNIPSRSTPVVTYGMIVVCGLAFAVQMAGDATLIERLGMIPARVLNPDQRVDVVAGHQEVLTPRGVETVTVTRPAAPSPVPAWLTLLTCIFLHGGWMHLLGNMWFLFIFGDNVEDCFGHFGYLLFYLGCGVAASAAHLAVNPGSSVPTIGASGAIAGVMGAYMYLYPRATVLALVPLFVFFYLTVLPAPLFLGIWFLLQFFSGVFAITATQAAGVAWWAHIGGFVVGFGVAWLLSQTHHLRPCVQTVDSRTERASFRRGASPW
jgi:membrane associated rhomboid family serine protease